MAGGRRGAEKKGNGMIEARRRRIKKEPEKRYRREGLPRRERNGLGSRSPERDLGGDGDSRFVFDYSNRIRRSQPPPPGGCYRVSAATVGRMPCTYGPVRRIRFGGEIRQIVVRYSRTVFPSYDRSRPRRAAMVNTKDNVPTIIIEPSTAKAPVQAKRVPPDTVFTDNSFLPVSVVTTDTRVP